MEKGGTIQGVIDGLNHILDLAVAEYRAQGGTWIVPGRGRLCDTADVASYRNMLVMIRDRVRDLKKKGMTLEQVRAARPTLDFDSAPGLGLARAPDVLARSAPDPMDPLLARTAFEPSPYLARPWLSAEDPLRVNFTLSALRIVGPADRAESLIRRVRQQGLTVQAAGGNDVSLDLRDPNVATEDPRVRLVRAILRSAADLGNSPLTYQPLAPLAGNLSGQYLARMQLKPPRSSHSILIEPAEYLPLARSLGLATQAFFKIMGDAAVAEKVNPVLNPPPPEPAKPPRLASEPIRLLALLQREGRLLDFLLEDISAATDEQVGAGVREIHKKAQAVLKEHLTLEPVLRGEEGATVTVPVCASTLQFSASSTLYWMTPPE